MPKKILWKSDKRKLGQLKEMEGNPRMASEKEAHDLDRSLSKFGLADPVIINVDNTVIGGHFRRSRLIKKHGEDKIIDVRIPSRKLTNEEVIELNLRLNKNIGRFDYGLLANFSEDVLSDVGFTPQDISDVFHLEDDDPLEDKDIVGTFRDYADYIIIVFESGEEGQKIREKMEIKQERRTIKFKEFVDKCRKLS